MCRGPFAVSAIQIFLSTRAPAHYPGQLFAVYDSLVLPGGAAALVRNRYTNTGPLGRPLGRQTSAASSGLGGKEKQPRALSCATRRWCGTHCLAPYLVRGAPPGLGGAFRSECLGGIEPPTLAQDEKEQRACRAGRVSTHPPTARRMQLSTL